eukprot:9471504-Pyramimonas_sp.AAC.1
MPHGTLPPAARLENRPPHYARRATLTSAANERSAQTRVAHVAEGAAEEETLPVGVGAVTVGAPVRIVSETTGVVA